MPVRKPFEQNYYPPVPTGRTLYFRTSICYQVVRFLLLNLKILRMVRRH